MGRGGGGIETSRLEFAGLEEKHLYILCCIHTDVPVSMGVYLCG